MKKFDSDGIEREASELISLVGVTPDTLTAASIEPQNMEVGKANQDVIVRLTPKNQVPANGFIEIQLPYWFSDPNNPLHYFDSTNVSCTAISGVNSGLTCTYNSSNRRLKVANILTGASSSLMEFQLSGFKNPLSTGGTSGFIIRTSDSQNGFIDRADVVVTVTQPAVITTANLSPSSIKTVGELTIMNVIITNPVPLEADCRLKIVFPAEIPIS